MRFSIIIPVYNVEEYIEKCLASVLAQDFEDYEVLIVDDESPDASIEKIAPMCALHPDKIQVIHQKNKGLGGARNTGVAAARGEYLVFVDSDDALALHALRTMDEKIAQQPCDILMFNYCSVDLDGNVLTQHYDFANWEVCRTIEQKNRLLLAPPQAWSKVFRREFYECCDVQFPEKTLYEDIVTRLLTAKAETVTVCPDFLYHYRIRPGSIMNETVSLRVMDVVKMTDWVCNRLEHEGLREYQTALAAAQFRSALTIAQNTHRQQPGNEQEKKILQYLAEKFPDYAANPFLPAFVKKDFDLLLNGNYMRYNLSQAIRTGKSRLLGCALVRQLSALRRKLSK